MVSPPHQEKKVLLQKLFWLEKETQTNHVNENLMATPKSKSLDFIAKLGKRSPSPDSSYVFFRKGIVFEVKEGLPVGSYMLQLLVAVAAEI